MADIVNTFSNLAKKVYVQLGWPVLFSMMRRFLIGHSHLGRATKVQKNWLSFFLLGFMIVSELCLPIPGRTQSFSDTGLFYFTGAHNPTRRVRFRDFIPGFVKPGSELKVGPVLLHPFLGVAEVYTDNAFRRNESRQSDFLTTIAPGIQALLPFGGGRHSFLLDYRAGQFLYNRFPQNNALTQEALGEVSLKFPGGLEFEFRGGHIEGFDPRGSELDIGAQDITKWNANRFESRVSYLGNVTGVRLQLTYNDLHYKNNNQAPRRDRFRLRADLSVLANITATNSAVLGVQVTDNTYDKNTQLNSFEYTVYTGFRLAPSRLLSGELNVGYSVLNFDRAPVEERPGTNLSRGGKQQQSLFIQGALNWRPTSRLSFGILPYRTIAQAAVFDTSTFITTGIILTGRQAFTDRLAFRGSFGYVNDDFADDRRDHRIRVNVGPEFRAVRWLGFRFNYTFERRISTESVFEYYSNTFMVSAQVFL